MYRNMSAKHEGFQEQPRKSLTALHMKRASGHLKKMWLLSAGFAPQQRDISRIAQSSRTPTTDQDEEQHCFTNTTPRCANYLVTK
jgi:hypothetical protein